MANIKELIKKCSEVSSDIAITSTQEKNLALKIIANQLMNSTDEIIEANNKDIEFAKTKKLSPAMIDRLVLDKERINKMADSLIEIANLPDPVGKTSNMKIRPNGIKVEQMSIPLGVIGFIYESRPNVTSDAAGLCLKSGNAVILRGGSEAFHSNSAIVKIIKQALKETSIPPEIVTFIPTTDRKAIAEMIKYDEYIDMIIPRGGENLIRFVTENSRIPVIKHYKGVCHLYIDESADLEKAINILVDGKISRPGVCNSLETLLVNKNIAEKFFPKVQKELVEKGVEIRGCSKTQKYFKNIKIATDEDYYAEFLSLIIAVKVVDDIDEAITHIKEYSSDHTEVIVTNNLKNSQKFINEINSSVVMVNASSRFSDGGELGLGAEIGISTTKLHAYGPMGLEALTTKKFVVLGDGQIRE
ncbi:MAG: glutamate-5-semialdehyde dehydrogenase [Candidatus Marinimicrobia bacterium]|nr:glutamate-5-semialdehyde dehydrogenase [Candidatus Neomarinimicrobiota bacterium]